MASKAAQEIVLGDTELRVFPELFAAVFRCAVEEMRRPLGEIVRIDPARADQSPIDMVLDHALECPGLRAFALAKARVEIEAVFLLDMRADEGRIGDAPPFIVDIGQLPLGRCRRHRPLFAIGKPGHPELDLGLGHERADFRQAEACAKTVEGDHVGAPNFFNTRRRLAKCCCHHGVSSGTIVDHRPTP